MGLANRLRLQEELVEVIVVVCLFLQYYGVFGHGLVFMYYVSSCIYFSTRFGSQF